MNKNKYNIGDRVYHVALESPQGIIIDIRYLFSTESYEYAVSFAFDNTLWCQEHEITQSCNIV